MKDMIMKDMIAKDMIVEEMVMKDMNKDCVFEVEPTSEELKEMEAQNEVEDINDFALTDDYDGDSMKLYLNEIGRFSLLTFEEEQQLSRAIIEGGEEAAEARERMVNSNLRLVMHYAKKFVGRGVELDDLNTMGIEGLLKAVEKFDYSRGYHFSTYASWWIKQAISRGIADEGATVRIPVHMNESINKVTRAIKEYYQQNGENPSIEEICEITGYDKKKVEDAMASMYSMVSFDTPVGEDGDSTFGEFLQDTNSVDLCDAAMDSTLKEDVGEALNMLTEKEALVIRHRYGIGGGEAMTLEEIAKLPEFGVTRERIRQIEAKALRKLQRNKTIRKLLKDYVA